MKYIVYSRSMVTFYSLQTFLYHAPQDVTQCFLLAHSPSNQYALLLEQPLEDPALTDCTPIP